MIPTLISRSDVEALIAEICARHKVSVRDIKSKSRLQPLVEIRKEISVILASKGMPLNRIGKYLNRDHTTIHHYVKDVEGLDRLRSIRRVDILDEDINAFLAEGYTVGEIAEFYGAYRGLIRNRINRQKDKDHKDPS